MMGSLFRAAKAWQFGLLERQSDLLISPHEARLPLGLASHFSAGHETQGPMAGSTSLQVH